MANILLTEKCNRACPYCFAKEHMDDSAENTLSWENLIFIADFLATSHEWHISLLGGEPTLHPDFVDYALYLLTRNFHVNVFTNGIVSEKKLSEMSGHLKRFSEDRISFVCNVNHPDISPEAEIESQKRFLKEFNTYSTLSVNIYRPDFSLDYAFDYITDYDLKKNIRIGLAHPIPGEINSAVTLNEFNAMADQFVSYFPMFEQNKVAFGFDCGMPLCLYTDEQIGKIYKTGNGLMKFGCGPAIDIGPDMMVWSCFPLSAFHKKSLYEFDSLMEVGAYFEKMHKKIREKSGGIFDECINCFYREKKICTGGCISHIISAMDNEQISRIREEYP